MFSFFGGGHGGNPESDGLNHGNAPISTATIPPLEILEAAYPVMFTRWALRADSGGPGRAPRRAGCRLRDRAARGAGRRLPVRRARQVCAARRHRRLAGGAEQIQLPAGQRRFETPPHGFQDGRHLDQARRAAAVSKRRAAAATASRSQRDPEAVAARRAARLSSAARRRGATTASRGAAGGIDEAADIRTASQGRRVTTRPHIVVGVDVGGTFTDLFFYRRGERHLPHAQGAVDRGDQSLGFLDGIAAGLENGKDRGFDALAAVIHGTTVGTNALLERKGARTGIITTAGFRDVLEMRRRDRPQHLGPVGRVRAGGAARPAARGRRAHAGRRHGAHARRPRRGARRRRRRCARAAPMRSRSFFINAYANRDQRARGARGPARGVAQRLHHRIQRASCRRSASSSAARPRRSTPTCSRSSPPTSKSLDRAAGRRRLPRRAADRAVERRRDVGRHRGAAADPHRAVGPRRGRDRRRRISRARPASRTSSPATWAAPASTSR